MLFLLTSKWRVLDGVCPSNDLVNIVVQFWSVGDDVRMAHYSCFLVKGSVWVSLSPQMLYPLAYCCIGAAVLLLLMGLS